MVDESKFIKYKRIPHLDEIPKILNNSVEVYEKIDGGNCQVRKIEGRVLCGSRAHFLEREEFFRQNWFRDFQKWALKDYRFYDLPENLAIYGEWTSHHTLSYKPEFTNKFFMIDVLDLDTNRFIPYNQGKDRLLDLNIESPIYLKTLFSGKINIEQLKKMVEKSDYRKGNMEGIIIKDYNSQKFAKLWTSSVKREETVTQSDVNSIFLSLKDEGVIVTASKLFKQVESDLRKSGRIVSTREIERAVKDYLSFQV